MHNTRFLQILLLILILVSCKKNPDQIYGPCGEEPIGIDPLFDYSFQFGVRTEENGDLVDFVYHKDSIHLLDSNNNEILISWTVDVNGSNLTESNYFFDSTEDSLSFHETITKMYYIDFHELDNIDRDTMEIQFQVEDVECGQILNPLRFYHNSVLLNDYGFTQTRIMNLTK